MNAEKQRDRCSESSSTQEQTVISLAGITKCYPTGSIAPLGVLKGIDLEVRRGQTVAIVGPSGSGKSTLLNIMGMLDTPSSGQVRVDGVDPIEFGEGPLARLRAEKIGFVFQLHHLLPQCTVLENVLIPALALNTAQLPETVQRAEYLLGRVGLLERSKTTPGQLSGGERQRVAVVRALVNRPVVLLADEPTGSLDRVTADRLADLLLELNHEEHVALVVVTHSLPIATRMQLVFELRDGKLFPWRGSE
ncbi:MAG: ABC transporter ATP-binding protein [Kiritimatiellia bacterium]